MAPHPPMRVALTWGDLHNKIRLLVRVDVTVARSFPVKASHSIEASRLNQPYARAHCLFYAQTLPIFIAYNAKADYPFVLYHLAQLAYHTLYGDLHS